MARLTTRDYKRSSRNSGAAKLKEFGLGVLVGAVLASAGFLIAAAHAHRHAAAASHTGAGADTQSTAPHAPAPDDTSDEPDPATPAGAASSAHSAPAPGGAQPQQYDFYRMLPSFKVPVPHDDEHPTHAGPAPVAAAEHAAAAGPSYVVQIGSYRSSAQADAVRARLARAGIAAQVKRSGEGSSAWNRVRIGPLSDTELTRIRKQLRTANIHALVIREDR
jgi:cell division protein FtsN